MWTVIIVSALVFALRYYCNSIGIIFENLTLIPSSARNQLHAFCNAKILVYYHDQPPPPNRMPIFSPDRGHIWNGHEWIPNNGGKGFGFILGILIVVAIVIGVQLIKHA